MTSASPPRVRWYSRTPPLARRLAVLALAIASATCDRSVEPSASHRPHFTIAPMLTSQAAIIVDATSIDVVVTRLDDGVTFVGTCPIVQSTPNQTVFECSVTVTVDEDIERFQLDLTVHDAAGNDVYEDLANPTFDVHADGGSVVVDVPIVLVGPEAAATQLRITTPNLVVQPGASVNLSAEAIDGAGQVIPGARIGWVALDALVTVPDVRTGTVTAGTVEGVARVVALLPTVDPSGATPAGHADTTTVTVTALAPPIANAGGPYTGTTGSPVAFNGTGSTDPDGTIVSYAWTFGDGSSGTGATPTHTYTA
ncbi:MAG: PKD domain-containing protein, partial [Gemmatimonadota bacterium]|nr:PKD domain-containing protein [Gemmatimonadota bacterium]